MTEQTNETGVPQVGTEDFIEAVVRNDTLQAAGEALASLRNGEPMKVNSVYNRYNKMRKQGFALPDRPLEPSKSLTPDEGNALIERLMSEATESDE